MHDCAKGIEAQEVHSVYDIFKFKIPKAQG